jgi:hypothetical protein
MASVELGEAGEGAVEGLFYLGREDASGELVVFEVVGDAFAALTLARAGFIGAGAAGLVGFDIAFHGELLFNLAFVVPSHRPTLLAYVFLSHPMPAL